MIGNVKFRPEPSLNLAESCPNAAKFDRRQANVVEHGSILVGRSSIYRPQPKFGPMQLKPGPRLAERNPRQLASPWKLPSTNKVLKASKSCKPVCVVLFVVLPHASMRSSICCRVDVEQTQLAPKLDMHHKAMHKRNHHASRAIPRGRMLCTCVRHQVPASTSFYKVTCSQRSSHNFEANPQLAVLGRRLPWLFDLGIGVLLKGFVPAPLPEEVCCDSHGCAAKAVCRLCILTLHRGLCREHLGGEGPKSSLGSLDGLNGPYASSSRHLFPGSCPPG